MRSFLAGLALGLMALAAGFVWHLFDRVAAYQAGQTAERLVWQERQAMAEAEAERARKVAQAEIRRIEADYWRARAGDRDRIAELEKVIDDDAQPEALAACPGRRTPLVGKRVRDNLNAIGR